MEIREELKDLKKQVSLGLKEAYRKMAEFKKKNNSPLIVSKGGKVIAIPPEQILPTTNVKNEYSSWVIPSRMLSAAVLRL